MGRKRISLGVTSNRIEKVIYWVLRLFIGGLFIFSSIHKIVDPFGFAVIVNRYQLTPGYLVNFVAIVMPYVELFCGLAVFFGIWRLGALFLIQVLLVFFSILIGINIIRGIEFTCGCFSNSLIPTFFELPGVALVRDIILVAMGFYLFKLEKPYFFAHYLPMQDTAE